MLRGHLTMLLVFSVQFQTDGMSMKLGIGQESAASLFKVHLTWEQVESSSPVQSDPI